jgi:phage baseplate assembly protein W
MNRQAYIDAVKAIDSDDDRYVGIGFPLGFNVDGRLFNQTKTVLEQAKSNLRNLLLTTPGERVGQPDFGCNLIDILFDQNIVEISNKSDEIIREAVAKQLPYIIINDVFVSNAVDDSNQLNIQIEFSVSLQPDVFDSLLLQFTMNEMYGY